MTWDDHELDNNYAAWIPEEGASFTGDDFIQRRKNAYQVYAETMPLRARNRIGARRGTLPLFRKLTFGDLADIHVLDTRQFRTDQPAGDGFGSVDALPASAETILEATFGEEIFDAAGIEDPSATMLGLRQELWLAANLRRSRAKWNVLAQQVMQTEWNLLSAARLTVEAQLTQLPPDPASQAQAQAVRQALAQVRSILNVDAWDGIKRPEGGSFPYSMRFVRRTQW